MKKSGIFDRIFLGRYRIFSSIYRIFAEEKIRQIEGNNWVHYQLLTSLESLTSTLPVSLLNFTYAAAVNGSTANRSRRFWWLLSKAFVSGYLVAAMPSSPILNTLNFYSGNLRSF